MAASEHGLGRTMAGPGRFGQPLGAISKAEGTSKDGTGLTFCGAEHTKTQPHLSLDLPRAGWRGKRIPAQSGDRAVQGRMADRPLPRTRRRLEPCRRYALSKEPSRMASQQAADRVEMVNENNTLHAVWPGPNGATASATAMGMVRTHWYGPHALVWSARTGMVRTHCKASTADLGKVRP